MRVGPTKGHLERLSDHKGTEVRNLIQCGGIPVIRPARKEFCSKILYVHCKACDADS